MKYKVFDIQQDDQSSLIVDWWNEHIWYPIYRIVIMKPYDFMYQIKWMFQHIFRGYSDPSVWDADYHIAKYALPRIRKLKTYQHGFPPRLATRKEWKNILGEIVYALQYVCSDDGICPRRPTKSRIAIEKRVQNGLELFGKYFRNLWD